MCATCDHARDSHTRVRWSGWVGDHGRLGVGAEMFRRAPLGGERVYVLVRRGGRCTFVEMTFREKCQSLGNFSSQKKVKLPLEKTFFGELASTTPPQPTAPRSAHAWISSSAYQPRVYDASHAASPRDDQLVVGEALCVVRSRGSNDSSSAATPAPATASVAAAPPRSRGGCAQDTRGSLRRRQRQ
jgi:hypothetical protein